MEFDLPVVLWLTAGAHALIALAIAARAGRRLAGPWAVAFGLLLAATLAVYGGLLGGRREALAAWWLLWAVAPGLLLPLAVTVANTSLRRQLLLAVNGLLALAAVGLAWHWRGDFTWRAVPHWGAIPQAPAESTLLAAWAAVVWLAALGDTGLGWLRRRRPRERQRLGLLLAVLLAWGLGWALDWLALLGHGPGPWGFVPAAAAHLALLVLLWADPGPRRIRGTVAPELLAAARQPVLIADGDNRIQAANPAALRLLERRRYQVLGAELPHIVGLDVEHIDSASRLHGAGYVERVALAADARSARQEVTVQPVVLRADSGEVLAVICTLHAGSADPALAATSLQDPVTGAAGAALGEALIAQELRRHAGGSGPLVAAIFVQIDDAAGIAARHGRTLYDRLQAAVAERLAGVCDWPLDLARTAGGGFVLLLSQVTDDGEVMTIAERAHAVLNEPFELDGQALRPPALVAVLPDLRLYTEVDDVLGDGRLALQQARHQPGEPLRAEARGRERVDLALALESAVAHDALELRLTPVLDLRRERVCGARLSLHWEPEGFPALSDEELRRLARRVHLEAPLAQWRIERLRQLSLPRGFILWLSVDLEDLQNPAYARTLTAAAGRQGPRLALELPDPVWTLPAARKVAADLSAAGYALHARHFSSEASVVTHAAGAVPRSAGIGARLVATDSPATGELLRGLVQAARRMGIALRADDLRNKAELRRLRAAGLALASGEYFADELTPEEFDAWADTRAALAQKFAGTAPEPGPEAA